MVQERKFPENSDFQDILMISETTSLFIFQKKDVISLWGCNSYTFIDDCVLLEVSFDLKETPKLTKNTF